MVMSSLTMMTEAFYVGQLGTAPLAGLALGFPMMMLMGMLSAGAFGGTITGEHGVGMGKLPLMEAEHGAAWAVMGQIKRALDPQNLMNTGKLVPQPKVGS